jgi:hypothetical protein
VSAARLALPIGVAALTAGCLPVTYGARRAPLGDPPFPAAHVESVTTGETHDQPGVYDGNSEKGIYAKVTRNGFEIEDHRTSPEFGVEWDVRIAGGAGVDVVTMMWSPATAPPCQGGHPARDLLLDRVAPRPTWVAKEHQVHWERPLVVRGERVVSGHFDEDPALLHETAVVDVTVVEHDGGYDREVCVRVPVTGQGVTYWSMKRWSFGYRFGLRRAQAFTQGSTFSFGMSFGRWLGPVRLALEAGISGTNDDGGGKNAPSGTWLCFAAPGPDCETANLGTFALEASGPLRRWGRTWGLGWSLGYETSFGALYHLDPAGQSVGRRVGAGGPRVGLRLFRGAPDLVGVSPFSPTSAWGVELFAAAAQEYYGAPSGHTLSYGLAVVSF